MKKEVVIAIIVGFCLGLAITFGIYTAQKALQKREPVTEPTTQTPPPTPSHSLTLASPLDESLVDTDIITVTGTTAPNSTVTLISLESQTIISADDQGDFTADIKLTGGANIIQVAAYDPQGNEAQQQITVVYSTEFNQSEDEPNEE